MKNIEDSRAGPVRTGIARGTRGVVRIIQPNPKYAAVSSRTGPVAWCDHGNSTDKKFLRVLHSALRARNRTGEKNRTGPVVGCGWGITYQGWKSLNLLPVFSSLYRHNLTLRCPAHSMMTSSDGNISRVTGPLCGEFTGHRWIPHTKASDAGLWYFFYLILNKRFCKQSWGWWFETPSCSLWRHCNIWQV